LPDRRWWGADAQAGKIPRRPDRLVREKVAESLHPIETDHFQAMLLRQLILPLLDSRGVRELPDLLERFGEIGPVHHGDGRNVVSEACRIRVLPDVCTLTDLLDNVLLDAELSAMEHLDLELPVSPLGDALCPFQEARMVRLAGSKNMIEPQRVLLSLHRSAPAKCGEGRRGNELFYSGHFLLL